MNFLTKAGIALPSALWISWTAFQAFLRWLIHAAVRIWPGVCGDVQAFRLHVWPPAIELRGLRLSQSGKEASTFSLTVERLLIFISWRALFKKTWVGSIRVERPHMTLKIQRLKALYDGAKTTEAITRLKAKICKLAPFKVERFVVKEGSVRMHVMEQDSESVHELTHIQGEVQGFSNSTLLSDPLVVTSHVECCLPTTRKDDTGTLRLKGTCYPFASEPTLNFDLQASGIDLSAHPSVFYNQLGLRIKGRSNVFAEVAAAQGNVNGYVKLIAEGVHVQPAEQGWLARLRAGWMQALVSIGQGRHRRVAVRIPFEGTIPRPAWRIGASITSFLHHAFGQPMNMGLDHSIDLRPTKTAQVFRVDYQPPRPGASGRLWSLLRETTSRWIGDDVPRSGAALSYYTAFSVAPLVILVVAVASFIPGPDAARGELATQLEDIVGVENAQTVQHLVEVTRRRAGGATLVGIFTLLLGGTVVLVEIKRTLNRIWRISAPTGFVSLVKTRFKAFILILSIGALLILSVFITTALAAITEHLGTSLPAPGWTARVFDFVISQGMLSVLFALLYKVLPDADIAWNDVALGAVATALLFTIGKTLLGSYLGAHTATSYGVAGSVLVFLLWVFYSSQIFYLGAEFTAVYALRHGSRAPAKDGSMLHAQ